MSGPQNSLFIHKIPTRFLPHRINPAHPALAWQTSLPGIASNVLHHTPQVFFVAHYLVVAFFQPETASLVPLLVYPVRYVALAHLKDLLQRMTFHGLNQEM